jgi:integrase/recombinase XerD
MRAGPIGDFVRWAEQRGIEHPMEVTRPILESYQRYLYYYRQKNGQPLTFRTQHSRLTPVCRWFRWLVRNNHILYNPASDLDLPRMEKRIPRTIFSVEETERVLQVPDIHTPVGLRDRAILETFYSTGIRRKELVHLKLYDVDRERATLTIRQGKGKKDRMIPIGERALAWVGKYLGEGRPLLAIEPDDGTLFLTQYGEPFHPDAMSNLARDLIAQANLGKSGSCHTFRHTMATLMLDNGADIRYIQQMLGHAEISSTEIYTHVAIRKLQKIHAATHPGATLERKAPAVTSEHTGQDNGEQKAELLAALDAEAEEESESIDVGHEGNIKQLC